MIGAQRYHGTDVSDTSRVYGGRGFGYNYDPIGNRTSASETIGGETLVKTYAANELNQYTAIANPDAVGLRGDATNTAVVTVNGNAASRDNVTSTTRPWHFALPADNANGPEYTFASIVGVVNPPGTNEADIVSTTSGSVYAPPQNETLTYDDDGNLLSDGRWHYTWNGENRLVCAEEQVCPTNRTLRKVEYAYDHQGRMVWKKISHGGAEAQSWEEEKATSYLWDDFNIVSELTHSQTHTLTNSYVWGLDIDGSMQGAGGVGGLLAVISPLPLGEGSTVYLPCYDANGNIMEYVSTDGILAAHREYDPFGGTAVATGDAESFTHWFSTKPWCPVTSLSEYQYRKYSPVRGRWLNRDPMEEEGGVNLLIFCRNDGIAQIDFRGLAQMQWGSTGGVGTTKWNGDFTWLITGMYLSSSQTSCAAWDWLCDKCCTKLKDGEAQVKLYLYEFKRDRPFFIQMPVWSTQGGHDIKSKKSLWYFRGYILRGDQMGNVQAGYALASVYGIAVGGMMLESAEWLFGLGDYLTGGRRNNNANWSDDAVGSFEMNDLGIQALRDDITGTLLSYFKMLMSYDKKIGRFLDIKPYSPKEASE